MYCVYGFDQVMYFDMCSMTGFDLAMFCDMCSMAMFLTCVVWICF